MVCAYFIFFSSIQEYYSYRTVDKNDTIKHSHKTQPLSQIQCRIIRTCRTDNHNAPDNSIGSKYYNNQRSRNNYDSLLQCRRYPHHHRQCT